ncbi:MAG: metal ABC transporter permease [Clostridia bacterium]|nr:metal ABC transporter permease [Clostridia bacterium]
MSISFDFSVFSGQYFDASVLLYALVVGIMTSLCSSALGVNLVLKRYSMIGDGLSHVGFLALAVAALFEVADENVIYITIPVVTVAAFFLMWLSDSGKLKGDSATALVSVGTVAVGYIIFGLAESGAAEVCTGLFGASVLTMKATDTVLCLALCGAVIVLYLLFYNRIFAVTFDEDFAKSAGVGVKRCNMLLSALTAITIVVGMKLLGSIMISAVIVIPAIASMRLFKTFKEVVVSSAITSVICFVLGFLFAVTFVIEKQDSFTTGAIMLPVGATVVCFNIIALLVAVMVKKFKTRVKRVK